MKLTEREKEILELCAKGNRVKDVAQLLDISQYTVQSHIRNIYDKLDVKSVAEAVAKALSPESNELLKQLEKMLEIFGDDNSPVVQWFKPEHRKPASGQQIVMRTADLFCKGFCVRDKWLDEDGNAQPKPDRWCDAGLRKFEK